MTATLPATFMIEATIPAAIAARLRMIERKMNTKYKTRLNANTESNTMAAMRPSANFVLTESGRYPDRLKSLPMPVIKVTMLSSVRNFLHRSNRLSPPCASSWPKI